MFIQKGGKTLIKVFLISSVGVFFLNFIVWNLVMSAVGFMMTSINFVKVSVRKLVKTFCKIGFVTLFSISLLLIFGLVAPKAKAYEETRWLEVADGVTPQQIADWCKTNYPSVQYIDDDNYIIFVYYIWGNRWIFDACFYPSDVTSVNFTDTQDGYYTANTSGSYITASFNDGEFPSNYAGGQTLGSALKLRVQSLDPSVLYSNKIICTYPPDVVVRPPVTNIDGYSVTPRGWTFSYDIYPLPTSQHIAWYYQTRRYIVRISATYEGQPITLDVPNYLSWTPTTKINPVVEPFNKNENGQLIPVFQITTTGADKSVESYYQNVMYYRFDTDDDNISYITMSQPDVDYTDDNSSHWVDTSTVEMTLSLYNLLQAFREAYPNNTFADNWLYQDFSLSFIGYDDNKTYYTQVLPYSVVSDKTDAPPDVDTNQNNWFDNRQTIIDNINNNATYDFLSNPPARWSSPLSLNSLDSIPSIDSPDYSFPDISTLDSSATGFFSWLVDLVVSSPIGLLILIGLGFLVVKAVVHQ